MKRLILALLASTIVSWGQPVSITLHQPSGTMKMGDKPIFFSEIVNHGQKPLMGIVLYLSLVNLDKGKEHPVDLEDWSAQKAVHIDMLQSSETFRTTWPMRLIQSGRYDLFVTAVLPERDMPVTSKIVHFDIAPKKTIVPSRIWPVALGMPLMILLIMLFIRIKRGRRYD
jgi:hypothetical protein